MNRSQVRSLTALVMLTVLAGCGTEEDRTSGEPGDFRTETADAGTAVEVVEARYEGREIDQADISVAALARAREAADDLTRDLASLVFSTMEEQGTLAAIEVCSGVAQERTAQHASEGVSIRRVSNRLRNPLNAPTEAEARELERLASFGDQGQTPSEIVRLVRSGDERTLHYMRPIFVMQPCLACHGSVESIDPGVRAVIEQRYPEDAAVGYAAGDLRGAVSVEVALEADGR